jgi:hypothetical protein
LLQRGPNSQALAEFLRETGEIKIEVLITYAKRLGIKLNPFIQPLQSSFEMEAQIDFPRANEESVAVSKELSTFLLDPESVLSKSLANIAPCGTDATSKSLNDDLHKPFDGNLQALSKGIQDTPLYKLIEYARRNQPGLKTPTTADELLALYHAAFARLRTEVERHFAEQPDLANESGDWSERAFGQMNSLKSVGDFYQYLAEVLVLLDLSPDAYPNIIKYTQYCNYLKRVDVSKSFAAIKSLIQEIGERLAEDDEDREFLALLPRLERLGNLLNYQIIREEVNEVALDVGLLEHSTLCKTLQRLIPGSFALREFSELAEEYEECFEQWMTWFGLQTRRAIRLADNTISCMLERGENQAILITGGFQRDDIIARLVQKRISHIVLTPIIRREISQDQITDHVNRLMGCAQHILGKSNDGRSKFDSVTLAQAIGDG